MFPRGVPEDEEHRGSIRSENGQQNCPLTAAEVVICPLFPKVPTLDLTVTWEQVECGQGQ